MSSLTYDEWVRKATTEAVPPTSDGLLHFGERAALVEQLSSAAPRGRIGPRFSEPKLFLDH